MMILVQFCSLVGTCKMKTIAALATALLSSFIGIAYAEDSVLSGIPVQLPGSRLALVSVTSPWSQDIDYPAGRPGGIYYNDCVTFINKANVATTHVQFIFAAVDDNGVAKRPLLPLDVSFSVAPGTQNNQGACRQHA